MEEKSRTVTYQKDFIETQSTQGRSKNPEQPPTFSGAAFPSVNSTTLSHFSKLSLRNIQSIKANERHSPPGRFHPPHQIDVRVSTAGELLVLPFLLVRKRKKQESHWECRGNIAVGLITHTAEVALYACEISPGPSLFPAGVSGKPCKHHQRSKHRRRRIFLREVFFMLLPSSREKIK